MKTDHVIALISRLRDRAFTFIVQELNRKNISGLVPSHGGILGHLYERGQASMKELAGRIGRDKSTVTALVSKLEKTGYVSKQLDPDDSRRTLISLTEKARLLQPQFESISKRLIDTAFKGFTKRDREQLITLLEKLMNNFS